LSFASEGGLENRAVLGLPRETLDAALERLPSPPDGFTYVWSRLVTKVRAASSALPVAPQESSHPTGRALSSSEG